MMQNAMWLASIFGPLMVINGLWMLFYHDNISKIMTSIKNTPALFHCCAMINLLLGLAIVSQYNMWMMALPVFVTLLGWWLIIRGVMSLFVPQMMIKMMMGKGVNTKAWGVVTFVWGLLLCWLAFWM
ncbi:MAG: hypothetical protein AB7H48_01725 [Parachlamydiales bacterium]|jgi:hypothetical protein